MQTDEVNIPYKAVAKYPKPYIMGIDPDSDKSGVAIWSRLTDNYIHLDTHDFAGLIHELTYYSPDELLIVVEAGDQNKGIWHFPPTIYTWAIKSAVKNAAEIGRRVGQNHQAGLMIAHFARANGYEVIDYVPNTPKWDAKLFKMITGLKSGHNQEVRDAVRCIHGR